MADNKKKKNNEEKSPAGQVKPEKKVKKKKKKYTKKQMVIITVLIVIIGVLAGVVFGFGYVYGRTIFSHLHSVELDENDLGNNDSGNESYKSDDIRNIALFGVDSRDMNDISGRSDAMLVVSVDKIHKKVKITSFQRDSYVSVEGYGKTKLTHAYAYGGYQLAVKTLNQNFGLDIKDFVAVNFMQFANIIDYMGGVVVNVSEPERVFINNCRYELINLGVKCEYLEKTGDVRLSGGQALAYARNRSTGTDFDRMDRQYEVLVALSESAKELKVSQYDDVIKMILSQCVTSLKYSDIISMGTWALRTMPSIGRLSIPNAECNMHYETIDGLSYTVYDIENAKNVVHKFIYEHE